MSGPNVDNTGGVGKWDAETGPERGFRMWDGWFGSGEIGVKNFGKRDGG
jgi:hypothetical protein